MPKRKSRWSDSQSKQCIKKLEYDSDEQLDEDGTWEHKRRKAELAHNKGWTLFCT